MMAVNKLTQMDNMRFGGIIRRLASRNINNMPGHAGGGNEAATREIGQFRSIDCCPFFFLAAKVFPSGACAINDAISINFHEIMVSADVRVDERFISPGGT